MSGRVSIEFIKWSAKCRTDPVIMSILVMFDRFVTIIIIFKLLSLAGGKY